MMKSVRCRAIPCRRQVALALILGLTLLLATRSEVLAVVLITHFEASPGIGPGQIIVTWGTETEPNTAAFQVRRSEQPDVNTAELARSVPKRGSATTGAEYGYIDTGRTPDQRYYYWLYEVRNDGTTHLLTSVVSAVASGNTTTQRRMNLPFVRRVR